MIVDTEYLERDSQDNCYCWFMSFHTDDVRLGPKGTYTIKVISTTQPCVLVHRENSKYVGIHLNDFAYKNKLITFNAKQRHALLPLDIAKQVIDTQSITPASKWFKTKFKPRTLGVLIKPQKHVLKFRFIENA